MSKARHKRRCGVIHKGANDLYHHTTMEKHFQSHLEKLAHHKVDRSLERPFLDALETLGYKVDNRPRVGSIRKWRIAYRAHKKTETEFSNDWVNEDCKKIYALLGITPEPDQPGICRQYTWDNHGGREWHYVLCDKMSLVVCEVRLWVGPDPYPDCWEDTLRPVAEPVTNSE